MLNSDCGLIGENAQNIVHYYADVYRIDEYDPNDIVEYYPLPRPCMYNSYFFNESIQFIHYCLIIYFNYYFILKDLMKCIFSLCV